MVIYRYPIRGDQTVNFYEHGLGRDCLGDHPGRVKPRKKLIRNFRENDGSDKRHHFANFSQHGLAMNCLWGHFEKSEAKRETLSGICGFVLVLARLTILPNFPDMVWEGIVLVTILEKVKPREKTYQQYVAL